MKARTLGRHFREGTKSLGRNGWMTFASVSAVTVTLLLVGVFLVLMLNLNHFATVIEEDVEVRVHIDPAATEADRNAMEAKIKAIKEVDTVTFSSKEQELKSLIESLGDEGKAFELFEQQNPLNDVFVIKTDKPTDVSKVAKQIEKYPYAAKVKYGQEQVEKMFKVLSVSRNIGLGLIIGLLFTAMFLISNTIKITIVARREEIEIMRLVGATNSFIRWPFFLEGLFLGLLGAVIPVGIVIASYSFVVDNFDPKLEGLFELLPKFPFTIQVSLLLVLLGAFIGIWGSMLSVRKFLKK
ncbi:permease-like cell division protein FtsX [Bacillus sp. CGMCC 1.16541]|uniref:permease-like cell division protein FtsX n=1 Tax=Bacillus sp. CGMCC 1.16541 TaxID=2185143 RepID=UPI000D72E3E1|nr:permease-like cell division protein FtsX [Bacillus sp. CGMCC 1.16541]